MPRPQGCCPVAWGLHPITLLTRTALVSSASLLHCLVWVPAVCLTWGHILSSLGARFWQGGAEPGGAAAGAMHETPRGCGAAVG